MSVLFYDSGVGGVAVLREFLKIRKASDTVYFADNANMPYGEKNRQALVRLSLDNLSRLCERESVEMAVIACNTLTAAAINELRSCFCFPIVGIQPAIKPAKLNCAKGIYVFGTTYTSQAYDGDFYAFPMKDLAEIVERGASCVACEAYIAREIHNAGIKSRDIKAAVLGCTHYSLIKESFERVLPKASIFDGCLGTAKRAAQVYGLIEKAKSASVSEINSVKLRLSDNSNQEIEKYVEIIYKYSCVKAFFCV